MEQDAATYPAIVVEEERSFLTRVMTWMCAGLLITGVIAWGVGTSADAVAWFDDHPFVFFGLLIAELAAVAGLSLLIQRMTPMLAGAIFLLYSAMNGLTFSIFFSIYTTSSIAAAFFVTSAMFGALAVYGYTTKRDLSALGSIAFMALIGLILASIVNLFWANDVLYWITTYAGVLIFSALTAYDMQKIKQVNVAGDAGTDADRRQAILGALALYLDFINLFLYILRIMGRRR
jgi:uncharacterized protein